ncbi:MAG: N-acetyl-gamma-glutamyl-phosphate reductase, partial [Deferribacteraceae bacterium]|nr:N-acetyl-gamma-glutamyl-phosphate reductase [Deferribacteraceae bacterium]
RTDNIPAMKYVANTPYVDIACYTKGDKVIIVSALDNLMKGASAQAVQCFNLRMGFDEGEGF